MIEMIPIDRIVPAEQRSAAVHTGAYTGVLLGIVMFGALFVANRLPWLESRALERNAACYSLFVLIMLIPVARFLNRPLQMFTSAMIGWVIFVLCYYAADSDFRDLFQVLRTPFEALVEGAVIYGVCAVGSWVGAMVLHARNHPIIRRRRRIDSELHHHHQ